MLFRSDVDVTNPDFDARFRQYWTAYWDIMNRRGVTEELAKVEMRRRLTLIGAMMISMGEADGMVCGTVGLFSNHLRYVDEVIGKRQGAAVYAAMNFIVLPERTVALVDTHVNENPTAAEIANITIMAAEEMKRLNLEPKAALLSHSNFGSSTSASAVKQREALEILRREAPWLEVDGEMHADVALDPVARQRILPGSTLSGSANLLVCPTIEAGNIAYNLLKTAAGGNVAVGPVLLGANAPVHVLTPSATVRRIVNMTALAVVDANSQR